jgi:SAM-dependent methyltransferase
VPGSAEFPTWFFDRADPSDDRSFYGSPRYVTHIDEGAIAAVGALYDELGIDGDVLDLMSSWVSHFVRPPSSLTALGLNPAELVANRMATSTLVHDLNVNPRLPLPDDFFDAVVCCVSVDYLIHPVEVFTDVARVLRDGGVFVCTFSNRCFPTKAILGWLHSTDEQHGQIVRSYFEATARWEQPVVQRRTTVGHRGDPLYAVWAHRARA